jgi:hypothetical protein
MPTSDFSNEFDLSDDVDRAVAIAEAARLSAKIKEDQAALKWFADSFRELFSEGKTETGHNGATVTVNEPNDACAQLDTDLIKKLYTPRAWPEYYKVDKETKEMAMPIRAQAVTFKL